jgi:hypothetical protein
MPRTYPGVEYQDYEAIRAEAKAEVLRELAKELATVQYVRPGMEGREEYEAMLAIRRGNTDAWLKMKAEEIEKEWSWVQ